MNDDAVRARFAANADRVAESSLRRLPALESGVAEFVQPTGDERVLDVGTGTGPLAFALAPRVREVVGIDLVPELLEHARAYAGDRLSERAVPSRETSPTSTSRPARSTSSASAPCSTTSRGPRSCSRR